jgi:GT2 family glycosyltransferase
MKPRVLHLITVYNGRAFVPRAIESAMRMDQADASIDVLVLDDASPEPGWSAELAGICKKLGAHYYCTPRNLGIPRNCSLGLTTAIEKGYDYVTINNSDVIFPANLISQMVKACQAEGVGSVTAWSNNVSIFSLPNVDPDKYLASQKTVDFISERLAAKYGSEVLDVPAGISFCIMMPVDVVRKVGVMDPVFGRGYCEETDWSLRSLAMGYRLCLAPGTFVYHQGRGSNLAAGLVSGAHTTVPENEAIIDLRHPEFRKQCQEFEATGVMPRYKCDAIDCLIDEAVKAFGYEIVPGWEKRPESPVGAPMRVEVDVEGPGASMRFFFAGFEQVWPMQSAADIQHAISRFGQSELLGNAFRRCLDASEATASYPLAVW